jgi:hypothetical protein
VREGRVRIREGWTAMADTSRQEPQVPPQEQVPAPEYDPTGGPPAATGWSGAVVFAGVLMIMLGAFAVIQGVVAIFDPGFYLVTRHGLLVSIDYTTWGWTHLILGLLAGLIGVGLLAGNTFARVAGVVVAVLSAIVNLAFIAAYPVWSTIVIALDVVVIYAIIVHGGELKSSH